MKKELIFIKQNINKKEFQNAIDRIRKIIETVSLRDDVSIKAHNYYTIVCIALLDLKYTEILGGK